MEQITTTTNHLVISIYNSEIKYKFNSWVCKVLYILWGEVCGAESVLHRLSGGPGGGASKLILAILNYIQYHVME